MAHSKCLSWAWCQLAARFEPHITLTEAQDLVKTCVDVEPGIVKLQMQSGLAMKLNQRLQDCELLIKSGVLRESAIPRMPARSRTISNREIVRCTSRDHLAQLQIGNFESRQKALDSFLALMQEDDKNVLIVAVQGTHCGVLALVKICQIGTPAAQAAATGTLWNLASIAEIKQNFIDENAILTLIVREGGIHPLFIFWDAAATPRAQEIAIGALKNLSFCKAYSGALISAGFTPRLVNAIKSGNPTVQQIAAVAIYDLASSMENRKALGEAGCISRKQQHRLYQLFSLFIVIVFYNNRKVFRREEKGISGGVYHEFGNFDYQISKLPLSPAASYGVEPYQPPRIRRYLI
eukprot:Gb_39181 [translate_table: standard]